MAEPITIARPYARAAFQSASSAGAGEAALGAWSAFLGRAAQLVADPQIQPLLGNPRVPAAQLIELLLELAGAAAPIGAAAAAPDGRGASAPLREEQRNFLALLAHNARLALLPQIAVQYEQLRAEAEHVADVQVLSARELSAEQSAKLQAALERRLGRTVRLHTSVDPTLLGGAVVHHGDYVVDGSLRRRVERLASAAGGA